MGSTGPPNFTVRADVRNGVARLALVGELDLHVAPTLQAHIDRMTEEGVAATLLDLRDLTFMDSAGVHLFVRAAEHAKHNGHRLAVVGVGGEPRKVLVLTDTEGRLIDEIEGMELIRRFTQSAPPAAEASSEMNGGRDG